MYEVYQTKAIIFSKKNFLERSKKMIIFTRDFGFVYINAHGIATEKSKNKNILQSGNLVNLYMIIGKNKWTVTGGEVLDNLFFKAGSKVGKEALQSLDLNLSIIKNDSVFNIERKELFDFLEEKYFLEKNIEKLFFNKETNEGENRRYHIENTEEVLKKIGYWKTSKEEKTLEERIYKINNILESL